MNRPEPESHFLTDGLGMDRIIHEAFGIIEHRGNLSRAQLDAFWTYTNESLGLGAVLYEDIIAPAVNALEAEARRWADES